MYILFHLYFYDAGYPGTIRVSSTALGWTHEASLGVYQKTSQIASQRPVWKHLKRDRFLFFNGKPIQLDSYSIQSFIGDWGRWVIYTEVTNEQAYITNELKDPNQAEIPVDQWMYSEGLRKWKKDETMRVEDEASGVDSNRLGKMFGRIN